MNIAKLDGGDYAVIAAVGTTAFIAIWAVAAARRPAYRLWSTAGPSERTRDVPPRYANATLFDALKREPEPMNPQSSISRNHRLRLRLDIGPLSTESHVRRPIPFPDNLLPQTDLWLDVVVTSTDFSVGATWQELGRSSVSQGRFLLPADGGPARTPDGGTYLNFMMLSPDNEQTATARIAYYYKNTVVQSQLLSATIGRPKGGFTIQTDYTTSRTLDDLNVIPDRPRLSIITNDDGNDMHKLTLRATTADGRVVSEPVSTVIKDVRIGQAVRDIRKALNREDIAPKVMRQSKQKLEHDLRALAPLGFDFLIKLPGELTAAVAALRGASKADSEDLLIHVARPTTSSYTFPWGLIYDIYLDPDARGRDLPVCPIVRDWPQPRRQSLRERFVGLFARRVRPPEAPPPPPPLLDGYPQECPKAGEVPHDRNLLCPFGFWGFRYAIEQPSSTKSPDPTIRVPRTFTIVSAETRYGVNVKSLDTHVMTLQETLKQQFPDAYDIARGDSKQRIQELLGQDLPLVYFYCHGERPKPRDPNTFLGVGRREKIEPDDIKKWQYLWRLDGKSVWDWKGLRPLIFVNACHSAEINPDTLTSYLEVLVGDGNAAGMLGTEAKVNQNLAMQVAIEFFSLFLEGYAVAEALRRVRLQFLARGNLIGLVYTPYCWADLRLVCAVQPPQRQLAQENSRTANA
jgi:hypothetical protein